MTKAEKIRESQLAIAKGMNVLPENLELIEKVKDWIIREWVYVCALDGMNIQEILGSSEKLTVSYIRKSREEYFREKYAPLESGLMHSELENLQKEVEKTCEESKKMRNAAMKMLSGQKCLSQADSEKIMQDMKEKDEKIRKLEKELLALKENRKLYQCDQPDPDNSITEKQLDNEDFGKNKVSALHFLKRHNRTAETKRFIERYLKDDHFSKEQVEFMLNCLEKGMKIKDIERFAVPGLSVEMMKRLSVL